MSELNKIFISERNKRKTDRQQPDLELIENTIESVSEPENYLKESIRLQEKESIRLLINYGLNRIEEEHQLYEYLLSELEDVEFQTPIYKEIFDTFKDHLKKGQVIDANYFIQNSSAEIKNEIIDMVTKRYEISENWISKKILVPKEEDLQFYSRFSPH